MPRPAARRPAVDPARREAQAAFAAAVRARFGIGLKPDPDLLDRRLRAAMEAAGWDGSPLQFAHDLQSAPEGAAPLLAAADAVTVRETSFFRDPGQLLSVARELAPRLAARRAPGEPVRVLSAGCATGEEAYSLAMALLDEIDTLGRTLEVCGVDLSPRAIEVARAGRYPAAALRRAGRGLEGWRERFFRLADGKLVARDFLRRVTSFSRGNLVAPGTLAGLGDFDLVLCRNVFIYFDAEAIERALACLEARLRPGGAIVLGLAEAGAVAAQQAGAARSGDLLWFARPRAP